MEYCEGGDMGQLIKKCKRDKDYIAEDVIWKIFMQIALALNECHHRPEGKVLHRDLKPGNIFLDGSNNVKLGDFGLSRVLSTESDYASTHVGTPYYMSPEQIKESRYNEKSDIWSAGCVVYEIAALRPPFEAGNQLALAMKIKNGRFDRLPLRYSEELQRVLSHMIRTNPEERPRAEDLLNIPQIAIRIKESKLKDSYSHLKRKDETLLSKQRELAEKEKELTREQSRLETKEKELSQLEGSLSKRHGASNNTISGGSTDVTELSYSPAGPEPALVKNLTTMDGRHEGRHMFSREENRKTHISQTVEKENRSPNRRPTALVRKMDKNYSQPLLLLENHGKALQLATEGKVHIHAMKEMQRRYGGYDAGLAGKVSGNDIYC